MKDDLRTAVNVALEDKREALIESLTNLLKIKSIEGVPGPETPFGKGPAEALNCYLAMGEAFGFETGKAGNFAGHILWNPTDKPLADDAGVLVHLDVVPADESSWTYPPFSGTVINDRIYGRGSKDDKGPAVAALFAMKALKDSGYCPKRGIRLIAGTNEETGSTDIPKYLKEFPQPAQSIVPDGCYPVVHGEKGIMDIQLTSPQPPLSDALSVVREFRGGTARNMVPDYCRLLLDKTHLNITELRALIPVELQPHINVSETEKGILLEANGESVHGALPEKGLNAISLMMELMAFLPINSSLSEFTEIFKRRFARDCYGRLLGCSCSDTVSGQLRLNVGLIALEGNRIVMDLNVRYPVTANGQEIFEIIRSNSAEEGMTAELLIDSKPLYFKVDDPFIEMLHKEYIQETGDKETLPLVMGGGTYARALKNAAAIGGASPFSEDRAHQNDEFILIEDLLASARIYAGILMNMTGQ